MSLFEKVVEEHKRGLALWPTLYEVYGEFNRDVSQHTFVQKITKLQCDVNFAMVLGHQQKINTLLQDSIALLDVKEP